MSKSASRHHAREAYPGARLLCLLDRHEPAGHRANWNGETYISRCEYCGAPIFRLKRGKWRRDRLSSRKH